MPKRERAEVEEQENVATKRVKTETAIVQIEDETADTNILTRPITAPRIKSEAPGAAEIQDDDLAITVLGHSFIHGIEGRKKHAMIFAKAYRELSYIKQLKRNPNVNPQLWKDAMNWTTPHESRKRPDEQYLVVGLVLQDSTISIRWDTPHEKLAPSTIAALAERSCSSESAIKDTAKLSTYLAVTTITPLQGINHDFFALMPCKSSKKGRPHTVRQDDVFFFSEYRSNLPTAKVRRRQWKATTIHAWMTFMGGSNDSADPASEAEPLANRLVKKATATGPGIKTDKSVEDVVELVIKIAVEERDDIDKDPSQVSNVLATTAGGGVVSMVRGWLGLS